MTARLHCALTPKALVTIAFFFFATVVFRAPDTALAARPESSPRVQVEVLERAENRLRLRVQSEMPLSMGGPAERYYYLRQAGLRAEPGEPLLPVVTRVLALPTQDARVRVRLLNADRVPVDLGPVPVVGTVGAGDPDRLMGVSGSALEASPSNQLLPPQPYRIERLSVDGLHLAKICFFPLSLRPASGQGVFIRSAELLIEFDAPGSLLPPRNRSRRTLGPEWEGVLLNPGAAQRWRHRRGGPARALIPPRPPRPQGGSQTVLRVLVDRDGMTALSGEQIAAAGVALGSIDLNTLVLYEGGVPEPILIEDGGDGRLHAEDRVLFYGRAPRGQTRRLNPYTTENVYFLSWGEAPGARMILEDGAPSQRDPSLYIEPAAFRWTVHVQEDSIFSRLGQNGTPGLDHWFWRGVRAPSLVTLPVELPAPDVLGANATVRVRLQGVTYPPAYPDHHLEVYFNSHSLSDLFFDGQVVVVHESTDLPMASIRPGPNEISLVAPGDTPAGNLDEVFVDWVEVTYDRLFRAQDGILEFAAPQESPEGLYQFVLKGFNSSDVRIFKLGVGELVNGVLQQERGGSGYEVTIQDYLVTPDVRYFALEGHRFDAPAGVELAAVGPDLRDPGQAAEMLVIAPRAFVEGVQPYVDWRQSQGVSVNLSILEDVFHQFGAGLPSPEALRSYFRMAMRDWTNPALRSVLLVGDGTWDYRNIQHGDSLENRVPAGMDYNVSWGFTSSDNWYALADGDAILPEIAVGRWTVRTAQELETVVNKAISYPASGEWRRAVEVIGGNGMSFRDRGEELIFHHLPPQIKAQRIYTWEDTSRENDPHFRGGPELTRDIDHGVVLLNFQGHGGGGIWSDSDLLDIEDVPLLRNEQQLPIVFSMTCYTGSYADPGPAAIGEIFLTERDKGAIAFFGSSGFSYEAQGHLLNRHLLDGVFQSENPDRTLGEAVLLAKRRFYLENDGLVPRDIVRAYNLIGDPELVPAFPQNEIELGTDPPTSSLGASFTVHGTRPGGGGAVTLSLFDSDEALQVEQVVSAAGDGSFSLAMTVPVDGRAGLWTVRAMSADEFGGVVLGVDAPVVASMKPDPDPARESEAFKVRTTLSPGGAYDRYSVVWAINSQFTGADTLELIAEGGPGAHVTIDTIPGQPGGREIFLRALAEGEGIPPWTGVVESFTVLRREDLTFAKGPQGTFSGTESVNFGVEIANDGQVDVQDVAVHFAWHPVVIQADTVYVPLEEEWQDFVGTTATSVYVGGKSSARAEIPWALSGAPQLVRVLIDPADQVVEVSEANNARVLTVSADRFAVTPQEGTNGPQPSADGNLHLEVQSGVVSETEVLVVERIAMAEPTAQADYSLPAYFDGRTQLAYRIHWADSTVDIGAIDATFHLAETANADMAAYSWEKSRAKWIRSEHSDARHDEVSVDDLTPGDYTIFENHDATPPKIELQSQGRIIAEGGYVVPKPRLEFLAQDANGVDVDPHRIAVRIDDQSLESSTYSVSPNPQHPNLVSVSIPTELGRGAHDAELEVQDVNGNLARSTTSFLIGESTRIRDLANYPNPARAGGTTFAFTLETDWLEVREVKLRIYTPSGRLVRAFTSNRDLIRKVDYSEVPWDLRDREGYPVANGVYFYRVEVIGSGRNERISELGKVAVLR